jgi:acyl CoA:acetate/3-ketoacid CoA transferase beta subunit
MATTQLEDSGKMVKGMGRTMDPSSLCRSIVAMMRK